MEEIWKDIKGYEGLYQVSNLGNVKRLKSKYVLEERLVRKEMQPIYKYYSVLLSKHGNGKHYFIHRLVAQEFLPNENNYPCVNHKDGNKTNNNVENLEWCTYKYNYEEAKRIGLLKEPKDYGRTRSVVQYDLNDNYIKTWDSFADIKRELGFHIQNIWKCCKNRRTQAHGYVWKYKEG